jgi:hypothetical protein
MSVRVFLGVFGALSVALAATQASGGEVFGSKLNRQITPGQFCQTSKGKLCTWVLTFAQGSGAQEQAPQDGTIGEIRLMACERGSFILQIARAQPGLGRARVVRSGPLINYRGASRNCTANSNFVIERFAVNVPVRQGDYLAVAATKVNFLYSAGDSGLMFDPPLPDGGAFRSESDVDGSGILMIQAELNPL